MSRRHQHGGRYTPPKARRYPPGRAADGWRLLAPDETEARRRLDRLGPIGDQLEAALGDQLGLLRGMLQADVHGLATPPSWARATTRSWTAAGSPRCRHLRKAAAPQPIWLLAWAPTLRCTACMLVDQLHVKGTQEDGTCDGCRRYVGTVWPTAATSGNLTVYAGLCDDCHRTDAAAGGAA